MKWKKGINTQRLFSWIVVTLLFTPFSLWSLPFQLSLNAVFSSWSPQDAGGLEKKEKCFNVHCTLQFMRVYNVRSRYFLSLQSFSLLFLEVPFSLLPQSLRLLSLSSLFLLFLMYTKAFHLINRSIVLQRVLALECVAGISQIYTGCTLPLKPGCTWSCNDGLSDIRGLF